MDELEFHPSEWSPGDTTFENENYHELMNVIEREYGGEGGEDFRTPREREEDAEKEQYIDLIDAEGQTPVEERFTPQEGEEQVPFTGEEETVTGLDPDPYNLEEGGQMFQPPLVEQQETQPAKQFSENEKRFLKPEYEVDDEQIALWDKKNFSGEHNMDQVLWQVNKIRGSEKLTAIYDRDGDGEYTIADRYDLSRLNLTPDKLAALNEKWLRGLENKDLFWRMRGASLQNQSEGPLGVLPGGVPRMLVPFWVQDTNMSRYIHRRRMHALAGGGGGLALGNEGVRQNIIGPALEFSRNTLATGEKLFSVATGGDFVGAATPITDFIMNDKDPMSANSMYMDPVQLTWGDSVISEVTYYGLGAALTYATLGKGAPIMLTRAAGMAGTGTRAAGVLNATAGGLKYAFGGGLLPKSSTLAKPGIWGMVSSTAIRTRKAGQTFAAGFIETFPAAMFRDRLNSGFDSIDEETMFVQRLAKLYPETYIFGRQWHAGLESPLGKQLSYAVGVSTIDGGATVGFMGAFKGLRFGARKLGIWSPKNAAQLKTSTATFDSTHYTQPIRDGDYYHNQAVQKANDIQEAAEQQLSLFDDGPSNPYYEPGQSAAEDYSTYGPHKNGQELPGQGTVADRDEIRQVLNDLDEIDGQVTVEGGSTGQLLSPVQLRLFSRFGVEDNFRRSLVDALINDPVYKAQVDSLPRAKRTLGTMHEGTLKRLQEIEGRDASSLSPVEYWGKAMLDEPLGLKVDGDEIRTWSIENLQVADALTKTLLIRLRDMAAGTTEMLGKTDIFASHGPMKYIADNLVLGLSEIKRTRFTWGLVRDMLNESGGKLQAEDIQHIRGVVARRADQIHQETQDGVRLMMKMLENNDSNELAEGMLEVFQMSNKIHNWKDFDAFMRSKIKGGEFDGKVHTGAMIRELQTVMVNSILSGPKTPLRAILGTTTNAYYNSLNEAAGALIRSPFSDDLVQRRVALAKAKAMVELIPEAWNLFRANLKTRMSGDFANIRTRYSEAPSQGDLDWDMQRIWTERNGTDGDKAALYITNQARTLNNNKLLGWSPRVMAATDDTFRWLLARARSKEMGLRKVIDELGDASAEITPAMMKKAEDAHFNSMLDIDGNINLNKDAWLKKQFEEITLTSELRGFAGKLDKLFNEFPLMKPFYLFARTGINGLNLTLKNTPGLGVLHKETLAILKHTGDDFAELSRYGITNHNDLANARSLITGRQAVGSAVVSMIGMKYMAGQLTGNGPADRQLKQQWINSGWKPNHLYFGNIGFDYSSIEPFNVIFSSLADIGDNIELMGSDWAEKRLQAVAFVLGRGLTSKTYMSGLDNMMQLIQMKPWAWNKTAANVLNNSIPLAGMRNEFGKWINPHMKELNSDMWSSLRNRNQASELIAGKPLLNKSDMLNGKPINNWNFIGRTFNAVSPIQLDIRSNSPGRKLLLDSNYDLKSTTYSFKGYSFAEHANVRAHFQNAMGTVPITFRGRTFKNLEAALDYASGLKDVKNSMVKMNSNKNNPAEWDIDPNTYPHNTIIDRLFQQARNKAWAVINDPEHPGYTELQKVKQAKDGRNARTRENRSDILDLSFPKQNVDLFPRN